MSDVNTVEHEVERFQQAIGGLREEIGRIIVGQRDVISGVLTCMLAGSHALLEGVPGLGKTMLVKTLAQALDLTFSRIQFTPDLMPADVIGTTVIEEARSGGHAFEFRPGPIFAHIVLADEINRATPKTQSALLEAMQERKVTVGRTTHELESP
ncbi:MAG: AAA family ATPase, partial [Polyangiaceae bacterium]